MTRCGLCMVSVGRDLPPPKENTVYGMSEKEGEARHSIDKLEYSIFLNAQPRSRPPRPVIVVCSLSGSSGSTK